MFDGLRASINGELEIESCKLYRMIAGRINPDFRPGRRPHNLTGGINDRESLWVAPTRLETSPPISAGP
jgi:hypothetical protein